MSEKQPLTTKAGCARIMWAIAVSDVPPTVASIAERLDADKKNVRMGLLKLYRTGLVIRAKRPVDGAYEYAIAPPEMVEGEGWE